MMRATVPDVAFRHYRNIQMAREERHLGFLAGGILLLALAIGATFIETRRAPEDASGARLSDGQALALIEVHCATCHSKQPTDEDFAEAPGGLALDELAEVWRTADKIYEQTVRDRIMPLGNRTGMTEEERQSLGLWLKAHEEESAQ